MSKPLIDIVTTRSGGRVRFDVVAGIADLQAAGHQGPFMATLAEEETTNDDVTDAWAVVRQLVGESYAKFNWVVEGPGGEWLSTE